MGRRFGRNQKRRWRRNLDNLEAHNKRLREENFRARRERDELVETIRSVVPKSSWLRATTVWFPQRDDRDWFNVEDFDFRTGEITRTRLARIKTDIFEDQRNNFRHMVHVRLAGGGATVDYMVSIKALRGPGSCVEHEIKDQLTRAFLDYWRSRKDEG